MVLLEIIQMWADEPLEGSSVLGGITLAELRPGNVLLQFLLKSRGAHNARQQGHLLNL